MAVRGSWWSITINNPTQTDYDSLKVPHSMVREMWYQTEIGEKGTRHIQMCLNTTQQRFSAIKGWLPTAHIELARNKDALKNYCKKSETSVTGSFIHWPDSQTNDIIEFEASDTAPELHDILYTMADYIGATDLSGNDFADVDEEFASSLYNVVIRSAYRQRHDRIANTFFGRNVRNAFIISWPVFYARRLEERLIELAQEEMAQTDRQEMPTECLISE